MNTCSNCRYVGGEWAERPGWRECRNPKKVKRDEFLARPGCGECDLWEGRMSLTYRSHDGPIWARQVKWDWEVMLGEHVLFVSNEDVYKGIVDELNAICHNWADKYLQEMIGSVREFVLCQGQK